MIPGDRRHEERGTPDRRMQHEERDRRQAWCDQRRVGDLVAVFQAGQAVRCPGTKRLSGGADVVCGHHEGWVVRSGSVVTVMAGIARWHARTGGQESRCPNCRMPRVLLEDSLTRPAA